jgi:acyl-homoserine-lactone acylase
VQYEFPPVSPADVTIVRDSFGIPHVYGKTDPAAAYGLAYAHAEDDFHTIQFACLGAKGLLGSVEGKDGAPIDFFAKFIRARQIAEAEYHRQLSPEFRAVMEGYVQGLNAYAAANPAEVRHKKAFPLTVIDLQTAYITINALMAGMTSRVEKILNGKIDNPAEPFMFGGSNSWVFHADRMEDGRSHLLINSHQPLEGPLGWYEAHVVSESSTWNTMGGLFPGSLCVLVGTTPNLGWAHTTNHPDIVDVYLLRTRKQGKALQYEMDGEWLPLESYEIPLKVKIGPLKIKVKKTAYQTIYGPALEGKNGQFYAIRCGTLEDLRFMEQWWRMNKATNYDEFWAALKMEAMSRQNVFYADRDHNILLLSNAKMPKRAPGYDWYYVVPGNTRQTLWTEFYPIDSLPMYHNPECGWAFNTNNDPFLATDPECNLHPAAFPPEMGFPIERNNRCAVVEQYMNGQFKGKKLSYQDLKTMKYDLQILPGTNFMNDVDRMINLDPAKYPDLAEVLKRLKLWRQDMEARTDNAYAPIVLLAVWDLFTRLKLDEDLLVIGIPQATENDFVLALQAAQKHLLKHFKTLDVPLGEFQRHRRHNVDLPLWGFPDNLASMFALPDKDGRFKGFDGDGFMMFVQYDSDQGAIIEAIQPYGASTHANSPHSTDQMELFVNMKLRPMTFDRSAIERQATRIYQPK